MKSFLPVCVQFSAAAKKTPGEIIVIFLSFEILKKGCKDPLVF